MYYFPGYFLQRISLQPVLATWSAASWTAAHQLHGVIPQWPGNAGHQHSIHTPKTGFAWWIGVIWGLPGVYPCVPLLDPTNCWHMAPGVTKVWRDGCHSGAHQQRCLLKFEVGIISTFHGTLLWGSWIIGISLDIIGACNLILNHWSILWVWCCWYILCILYHLYIHQQHRYSFICIYLCIYTIYTIYSFICISMMISLSLSVSDFHPTISST